MRLSLAFPHIAKYEFPLAKIKHAETIKSLESVRKGLPGKTEFIVNFGPRFQTRVGFGIVYSEKIRQICDFFGFLMIYIK